MTSAEWTPWIAWTLGVWAALFYAQLGDLLAERVALHAASPAAGELRGRAVRLVFVGVVLFLAAVLVTDAAARLISTGTDPGAGALLLVALAIVLAIIGTATVAGISSQSALGYRALRADAEQLEHARVTAAETARLRAALAAVDAARETNASGIAWWRFVPAAVGVLAALSLLLGAGPLWWLGLVAVLLPAASILLAVGTARTRAARQRAALVVNDADRAQVLTALDLLERRAARGIPGLSDRVSRALQILREQEKK